MTFTNMGDPYYDYASSRQLCRLRSGTATMITCEAFIAEACTAASYGRRNFFGVNLGRRELVPAFPYLLHAVFVVLIRAPANTRVEDLRLTVTSSWGTTFTYHVGSFPSLDREHAQAIEWSRLDFVLPKPGSFTLAITFIGGTASVNWSVEAGVGPLRQNPTSLPTASLLDGRKSWNPLTDLAREVRTSLLLADQFATPEFIRSLLLPGLCTWTCKVLVSKNMAITYKADWIALAADFADLEVRADNLIHDRFVLRDDEEAYAFGHSLKDLNKGRVSFFSRIYDDEQFQLIRDALAESWQRAQVVA